MKHETVKTFISSFLYLCREYGFTKVIDGSEVIYIPYVPDCMKESGAEEKPQGDRSYPSSSSSIPSYSEVKAYAESIGFHSLDVQQFLSYYQGKGWKVAGQDIFDWQGLVRKWQYNQNNNRR